TNNSARYEPSCPVIPVNKAVGMKTPIQNSVAELYTMLLLVSPNPPSDNKHPQAYNNSNQILKWQFNSNIHITFQIPVPKNQHQYQFHQTHAWQPSIFRFLPP